MVELREWLGGKNGMGKKFAIGGIIVTCTKRINVTKSAFEIEMKSYGRALMCEACSASAVCTHLLFHVC